MKRVALITNFRVPEKVETAFSAAGIFASCGVVPVFPLQSKDLIGDMPECVALGALFLPNQKLYSETDLIAVVGGDGSILDAVRQAAVCGIPVLGINRGRLGYMAELELSELSLIRDITAGAYVTENRAMLRVDLVSGGRTVNSCIALNDAVVTNGSVARIVDLQLSESGTVVGNYRSDGLIVATPTGSTAYSLSAGGPIVDPRAGVFVVTPVCAHSFAARPMIFPDTSKLEIRNTGVREPYLVLSVDGKTNLRLGRDDRAIITKSEYSARFVRVKPSRFYPDLAKKLESV
ncbi:MAG: NAD(+)/NADH kinase [Clostridia bacterium]|nr:NAD(+)/NADH kinase [Clostridia bacterium]